MAVTLSDVSMAIRVMASMQESLALKSRRADLAFSRSISLDNGTGANQGDKVWDAIRTIVASGTDDLDLTGAALQDAFGANVAFARVKGIFVYADPANTNNVIVGNAAATQFLGPFGAAAHTVQVRPGGFAGFACADAVGWPVVAGVSDLLRITNGAAGTPVTYSIVIIGASA